jgi:hypothetical protein
MSSWYLGVVVVPGSVSHNDKQQAIDKYIIHDVLSSVLVFYFTDNHNIMRARPYWRTENRFSGYFDT